MARLYRILRNLDGPKGNIIYAEGMDMLAWLPQQSIDILIGIDAITEVASPPLDIMEGWEKRALRLSRQGIITAVDLLTADAGKLAAKLRTRVDIVEKWQAEVKQWLTASPLRG